jgi:hypothetical protein
MTIKNFQQALNEEFSQQTYGENPVELYEDKLFLYKAYLDAF